MDRKADNINAHTRTPGLIGVGGKGSPFMKGAWRIQEEHCAEHRTGSPKLKSSYHHLQAVGLSKKP